MHLSSVLSRRATADFACYYYFFNELATARAKTIPLGGGTPPPKSHPPPLPHPLLTPTLTTCTHVAARPLTSHPPVWCN